MGDFNQCTCTCVCEGGFNSLNMGWRVSCLKESSERDGFKAYGGIQGI